MKRYPGRKRIAHIIWRGRTGAGRWLAAGAAALGPCLTPGVQVLAAPPTAEPVASLGAGPAIPATFDEAVVRASIAHITEPRRPLNLKMGYFGRRTQQAYPTPSGLKLVQEAAMAASADSESWFWLHNVLGFGAFRVPGDNDSIGFRSYQDLFGHVDQAAMPAEKSAVHEAIEEYVVMVPGLLTARGEARQPLAQKTLLLAWQANLELSEPIVGKEGAALSQPDWGEAIAASGTQAAFTDAVDAEIKDPAVCKTYLLLKAAALLHASEPKVSCALLLQAEPLLPQADHTETAGFYGALVHSLVQTGRLEDAVTEQQHYVQVSGRGRGQLATLMLQQKKPEAVSALCDDLAKDPSRPWEMNDVCNAVIFDRSPASAVTPALQAQVQVLLTGYLQGPAPLDVLEEFRARFGLATIQVREHDLRGAATTLEAAPDRVARLKAHPVGYTILPQYLDLKTYVEGKLAATGTALALSGRPQPANP